MFNFGELVKMEYRKLFQRKLVWITIAVLTAGCIFAGISGLLGKYYINGEQVDTTPICFGRIPPTPAGCPDRRWMTR